MLCGCEMNEIKKIGENIIGTVLSLTGIEDEYHDKKSIIEGWLTKRATKSAKNWDVRYFILYENALVYYADSESQYPRGAMKFDEDFFVADSSLGSYGFQVSNLSTTYYLQADTEAEKLFWMHTIAKVIRNLSPHLEECSKTVQDENLEKELREYAATRPLTTRFDLPSPFDHNEPPSYLRPSSPLPPRPPPRTTGVHEDSSIEIRPKLSAPLPPRPQPRNSPAFSTPDDQVRIETLNNSAEPENNEEYFKEAEKLSRSLHFTSTHISPVFSTTTSETSSHLITKPALAELVLSPSIRVPPEILSIDNNAITVTAHETQSDDNVRFKRALWQTKVFEHQQKQSINPFSNSHNHQSHPTFDKSSGEYGRPVPGSQTASRGVQANEWVNNEIERLLSVIQDLGTRRDDGTICVKFGLLFYAYQSISNSLVGILIRAKKRNYLHYPGLYSYNTLLL